MAWSDAARAAAKEARRRHSRIIKGTASQRDVMRQIREDERGGIGKVAAKRFSRSRGYNPTLKALRAAGHTGKG